MSAPNRHGAALLELLLGLALTLAAAALLGRAAARSSRTLDQGRALLEGTHLAILRREAWPPAAAGPCAPGTSGRDSGRLAWVEWQTQPSPGGMSLLAIIHGTTPSFPPETLATVLSCAP